ncbi:hypothetical protein CROQUDRAFT_722953 [Cronartium quercuum f. sp. fusiforme G11]|uniref:Uncharacterized protein n=1 Tax=Cronartium quercuum f. sp. fusiforme G11 TaxID=708437 RepID=A0A9P6TC31_9BASI|nr:hypothetical protein CROQUDRAFT_722953 [Cronartium quercuum f. sp. fusiforme G11]
MVWCTNKSHAGHASLAQRLLGPTKLSRFSPLSATCPSKRVILLGPSHQVYLECCAPSGCTTFATPLSDLSIDTQSQSTLFTLSFELFGKLDDFTFLLNV